MCQPAAPGHPGRVDRCRPARRARGESPAATGLIREEFMIGTQHPSHGGPDAGPAGGGGRGRSAGRWRRRAPMLAAALALSAAVVTQATPALAATTPQVSITCAATNECTATGTGFTPSGKVQVQALAGTTAFYTSTIVAKPVTWTGPCATPTTTTLLIPSSVESGFTAVNPAIVTAGSTTVTWGT